MFTRVFLVGLASEHDYTGPDLPVLDVVTPLIGEKVCAAPLTPALSPD
jgi:hypothetical protein